MNQKPLTIYDIAQEAGVSIATVSRVLAGHPNVSASTRERVTALVNKHQYKPSSIARGLEQGHSRMLGIVLPSVTHPYYAELYSGADQEAQRHGFSLLSQQLLDNACIGPEAVDRLIEQRLEGVLFVGGIAEATHEQLPRELAQLQKYMPVVAISAPIPGLECVYMHNDLAAATRQAVTHLQMLGHRRIAFLGGASQVRSSGARGRGFLEGISALTGAPWDNYHHEAGFTPEAGELAVLNLLSGRAQQEWPTALVAINDLVALGALRQLKRMGLRVPEDMAIIGCDNQFFSQYTDPPLTTIDLQALDHARSAIRVLLSERASPTAPFTQLREATLIVRESCGVRLGPRAMSQTPLPKTGSGRPQCLPDPEKEG